MAESSEPGRQAAAGGESLDEEEDEEREPLLPRIAWAPPRKGAPGTAVRLVEAAGEAGAAAVGKAEDKELLLPPAESSRCPSRVVGLPRSSPTDLDWNRSAGSGATRLCPSPRGRPRVPPRPHPSPAPRAGSPPCPAPRLHSLPHTGTRLVGKTVSWPGIPAGTQARGQPPGGPRALSAPVFPAPASSAPSPGTVDSFTQGPRLSFNSDPRSLS